MLINERERWRKRALVIFLLFSWDFLWLLKQLRFRFLLWFTRVVIAFVPISVVDAEDKFESEAKDDQVLGLKDTCRSKCCPENADVVNDSEDSNEKSKEDFSVEEKEKDTTEEEQACCSRETASFRVVWNKKNYEVNFPVDETADSLKQHIENLTGSLLSGFD